MGVGQQQGGVKTPSELSVIHCALFQINSSPKLGHFRTFSSRSIVFRARTPFAARTRKRGFAILHSTTSVTESPFEVSSAQQKGE